MNIKHKSPWRSLEYFQIHNLFKRNLAEFKAQDPHLQRIAKLNKGEVDAAIIKENSFIPIEVKWTSQLRPEDLKQIQCYSNGIILWKHEHEHLVQNTPVIALPKFLLWMPA